MTRLQSLIKEVLSQPKKKDCNCGCNDCGGKAPILTEGKVKHLISEGLQYHMDKKIQLHESVYRIGSEKHFELIREARALWVRGIINVSEDAQAILETHLGHFGMYEGEAVPLDMPMVENQLDQIEDWKFQNGWGFIKDYRREDEFGPNKKIAFLAYNSRGQKDLSKGQSLNVGLLDKLTPKIGQRLVNQLKADYLPSAMKITKDMIKQAGVDMVIVVDHNVSNNIINESKKKKKKDPPIGKPKRGGPKAYYVYVRDPKTKRIKKITFGSGGLKAKIRNPKARKAFAARHRCKTANDRTTARYWSCRLPRYAKLLGLGSNMNTFW